MADAYLQRSIDQLKRDVAAGKQVITPYETPVTPAPTKPTTTDFYGSLQQQQQVAKDTANKLCYDPCRISFTLTKYVPQPYCGDGILGTGEQCDDGNQLTGDGCSPTCKKEFCGDGILGTGEQCDDGNQLTGDGCSPTCKKEFCGDGILGTGEQCDDGNQLTGDGCSPTCTKEIPVGTGYCGDGKLGT